MTARRTRSRTPPLGAPFPFALPADQDARDRLAELGSIAGALVHELKNPLGAIRLNVEMLLQACQQGRLDPERSEARLRRILAGIDHLGDITQGFLSFARPGRPDPERVDINALLEDLLAQQDEVLREAGITVSFHPAEDLAAVPADAGQLKSVFLNIVLNARNALRHREGERRLIIATRNRRRGVRVVIANNGPPLPAGLTGRLFQPFVSGGEGGTGLGLAIVRRLVELHHGRVTASSDPLQGVSFTVELPTILGPARSRVELPAPPLVTVRAAPAEAGAVVRDAEPAPRRGRRTTPVH
jgi:signal transduction histidine kinase